jgi:molybdopterin-guanine dinucleotide biosynthesis protein A
LENTPDEFTAPKSDHRHRPCGRAWAAHGGEDKGLLSFRVRPLVSYALDALGEVAGTRLINANRNLEAYESLGFPVIQDANDRFDGPLAGLLSLMRAAATPYMLTVPCDTPRLTGKLLQRLVDCLETSGANIAVAHDGERLHLVVMLAETCLTNCAKRREKLSRVLGKRALKSFHPRSFNARLLAGVTWSDQSGTHCRTAAPAFC